jgi:hypothetical protein
MCARPPSSNEPANQVNELSNYEGEAYEGLVSMEYVGHCYPHKLGVTKEMMSRGPQVEDIVCREPDEQAEPLLTPYITMIYSSNVHHISLAYGGQQVLLHEVTSLVSW